MFFLGEVPDQVDDLLNRQQILGQKLMQAYDGPVQTKSFVQETALYDEVDYLYLGRVREGLVQISTQGADVLCFEAGDLFSLPRVFGLPHGDATVQPGAELDLIHRDDFVDYVYGDMVRQHHWSNYLLTTLAIYQRVLAHHHLKASVRAPKGFEQVAKGEVMIHEGAQADTVYQLMSGHADVTVKGVKVGEVLEGEMFGAMAVFTGEPRNATVTARTDCTLLSIPKERFVDLIQAKPETAMALLENMSRRITALNEQVIAQKTTASPSLNEQEEPA